VRLDGCDLAAAHRAEAIGVAVLQGERRSLAMQGWPSLASLWQQEAGF